MVAQSPVLQEARGAAAVPGVAPGLPPSLRPPAQSRTPTVLPAGELARLADLAKKGADGQQAAMERLRAVMADDEMANAFARVLNGSLPAHDPVHFVHELLLHSHRRQAVMFEALAGVLDAHQRQTDAVNQAQARYLTMCGETTDKLQALRGFVHRIADAQDVSMQVMEEFALMAPQLTTKIDSAARLLDLQGLRGWVWLVAFGIVWSFVGVLATIGVMWMLR